MHMGKDEKNKEKEQKNNENRTQRTKGNIIDIIKGVRAIAPKITTLNAQRLDILKSEYITEEYKAKRLNEVDEAFKALFTVFHESLVEKLGIMVEDEKKLESQSYIFDDELTKSLEIIKTFDGKTDPETTETIASAFVGNLGALRMIRAAYSALSGDTKAFEKYVFRASEALETLLENESMGAADSIASGTLQLQQLCLSLIDIGERVGVVFTDDEKETGLDLDRYYDNMARSSMGLPLLDE